MDNLRDLLVIGKMNTIPYVLIREVEFGSSFFSVLFFSYEHISPTRLGKKVSPLLPPSCDDSF